RAAFADNRGDEGDFDVEASLDRARYRLRLAARLGIDARISPGSVDEGYHRQAETLGEAHQAPGLAVPFRSCHAEIVLEPAFGIGPFFGTDYQDGTAVEPADASDHSQILAKRPVAGKRHEIGDQTRNVVERVRPLGVSRHLHLLPRGQARIGLTQQT